MKSGGTYKLMFILIFAMMFANISAYAAYSYSAQGLGGSSLNNTTPTEASMFTPNGDNEWILDVTYTNAQFKMIRKNNGVAGSSWGNASVFTVTAGSGITFRNGNPRMSGFTAGDMVRLTLTLSDGVYTLSAAKCGKIKITSSVSNPVNKGTQMLITATGTTTLCRWEYSYDGVTWFNYTGATSGTYNETITTNASVSVYYRATNSCSTDTYKVYVFIECSGRSQVHLSEDFGTLPYAEARSTDEHVPSSYILSPEGYEIHDGFYAVLTNSKYGGRGTCTSCAVKYPCPDMTCLRPASTSGNYWYVDRSDHTGNPNGGMLFLNCNKTGEVMYSYTQSGLCKNVYMTFGVWFASAKADGNPIKTQFRVLDENGDEILSARYDADEISAADGWKHCQTAFFSGDNETLTIQIINNGISGTGNDILVDDISFTSCNPKLEIKPTIDVICGDKSILTVESDGIDQIFGMEPYYLWQMYDYNAADPDDPWIDIADDPVEGRESMNGSGFDKVKYEFQTKYQRNKPHFRVIMSSNPEIARQVGHNIYPDCNVYAETDIVEVDCGCAPQEVVLTSGTAEQNVCTGTAISNVVFDASGERTDGIACSGLPDGLTATVNGTNMVISGEALQTLSDTTIVVKVFATGEEFRACDSDTLEFKMVVKAHPTLTLVEGDAEQSVCPGDSYSTFKYQWGGGATGVVVSDLLGSGLQYDVQNDAGKDYLVFESAKPLQSKYFTVTTTGQYPCDAVSQSGQILLYDQPVAPTIVFY